MSAYYGSQGIVTGASGLGSEYDYAYNSSTGIYDVFGEDYYEAGNDSLTAYYFYWYSPNSGDYYYGTAYDDGTYGYYTGEVVYGPYSSTESGSGDGYYYIYTSADASGSGNAAGYVQTYTYYYDADTGTTMSAYYGSQGIVTGTSGLGSEYDYAYADNGGYELFGEDYYEANNSHALTAYYFYWYSPNSGDYYYGTAYDDGTYGYYAGEVVYGAYSNTQTGSGDGYYYIYTSADASGSGYAAGYVQTYTYYYDADTGTTMSAYYGSQGIVTGASGLGSEYDYAYASNGGGYQFFGEDYYEANNTHALTAYYFYWSSPNSGDYYYGTAYDDGTYGYYAGEVVYGAYSNTQSGSGDGYYYIYTSADASGSGYAAGSVQTYTYYYDADTGTTMSAYYGSQGVVTGASGLGSEYDYAYNSSTGIYDVFGEDYYEAGNNSLTVYNFTWYSPNSGDYYDGTVYDDGTYSYYDGEVVYGPYSSTESGSGDGYYTITGSADASGSGYAVGNVRTGVNYYDADSGYLLYTYYGSQGKVSGMSGLGSEYDYATTSHSTGIYEPFGYDYYEANYY